MARVSTPGALVAALALLAVACAAATEAAPESFTATDHKQAKPYNAAEAEYLIKLCQVAYCSASKIIPWPTAHVSASVRDFKPLKVQHNALAETQSYIGFSKSLNAVVLVFRGTDNLLNWIQDILAWRQPAHFPACPEKCKVEAGFLDDYNSLQSMILDDLPPIQAQYPEARFIITGHSLGAAEAVLAAFDLAAMGNVPDLVVTAGDPRVGDTVFQREFNKLVPTSYRLVHNADPVPHVPPKAWGYWHVPTEIWYNEPFDSYTQCLGTGEDPACSDSVKLPIDILDHIHYFNTTMLCLW